MEGIWERMISALIRDQILEDDSLANFMCSAEAIVNNRLLTTFSIDHKDPEPLTPNHLLVLRARPTFPPGKFVKLVLQEELASDSVASRHLLTEVDKGVFAIPTTTKRRSGGHCVAK